MPEIVFKRNDIHKFLYQDVVLVGMKVETARPIKVKFDYRHGNIMGLKKMAPTTQFKANDTRWRTLNNPIILSRNSIVYLTVRPAMHDWKITFSLEYLH